MFSSVHLVISWNLEDREMMTSVGQVPMPLREVPGFALNRLQYAVLNESVNLVSDGPSSAEDLDVVLRHGLGLRYAIIGENQG